MLNLLDSVDLTRKMFKGGNQSAVFTSLEQLFAIAILPNNLAVVMIFFIRKGNLGHKIDHVSFNKA